ncbi:MAG: FecR domain-containing protein [Tannerellaceae bacterium]|jgi:ferric-dicitrate binding protein FerR (iron transport regulator)|nr:FecR domain-containing protein [Tannerellaceae bacterium]
MNSDIDILIAKSLSHEASEVEMIYLAEWLAASEENKELYLRLAAYWRSRVESDPLLDKEAAYKRLAAKIKPARRRARFGRRFLAVAAIAILLLACGLSAYTFLRYRSATATETFVYIAEASIASLTLPDSTTVSLNKHSRLTYTNKYGQDNREVALEGEAYFCVAKDQARPFVVKVGECSIVALGTAFNLRCMPEEKRLTATLIEGRIRFEVGKLAVTLTPGEQLSYNAKDKNMNVATVDGEIITAWKDNLLKYKSISFADFVNLLQKQYNVKISLTDAELGQSRVSGTFDVSLEVGQILEMMQKSLRYTWRKNGEEYMIYMTSKPQNDKPMRKEQ